MNSFRPISRLLLSLLGALAGLGGAARADAPAAKPAPADVVKLMRSVADYHLAHPVYAPRPTSPVVGTAWEFGVCWTGIMALAPVAGDDTYYKAAVDMGTKLNWQIGPRLYIADDMAIGQTYAELYLHDPTHPEYIAALKTACDSILAAPPDDNLSRTSHAPANKWSWCDALFMAPPAMARLTAATKDPKYLDYANQHWKAAFDFLYDKDEHLVYRDDRFLTMRDKDGKKIFWARGNGWSIGSIVRMLEFMPADHPDRAKYTDLLKAMSEKLLSLQQPDGSWYPSLLNPESLPFKEESGSSLFIYGMAWGINHGVLDRATYEPCVLKGWAFLVTCVGPDGKLGNVQGGGDRPGKVRPDFSTPFGIGGFLLAGSEVMKLGSVPSSTSK